MEKSNYIDDKANIESGHAKAVRERYIYIFTSYCMLELIMLFRFLQNAEQNHAINKRKTLKQITPPPESPNVNRRLN